MFGLFLELGASPEKFLPQDTSSHRLRVVRVSRVRKPLFKPQMEVSPPEMDETYDQEQKALPENVGKDIVVQEVSQFAESQLIHHAPVVLNEDMLNNSMPPVDLDKFLLRPIYLGVTTFAAAAPLGQLLNTWVFPDVYTANQTIRNKLEKIAFWRPTFEISIRMNGTPMHYGKLVFAWVPQSTGLNAAYTATYFQGFSNNWIQVSASSNQTTTITVPFTHYKDFISVGALKPDLFTLYCWVSCPLNSVNGAPPPVNFTVYARVIKTDLLGYNYVTDWVAQSETVRYRRNARAVKSLVSEAEDKTETQRVVSSTLRNIGDFVSKCSSIPVVGSLAAPVSATLAGLSSVAHWFGFDIPVNLKDTVPVQVRQPRMLQVEDAPTTLTLGTVPSLVVSKDYALVNDTPDAVSILRFMQRPALAYVGTVSAATVAGSVIYSIPISPAQFQCADYVNAYNPALFSTTPLSFMAQNFSYWRGGIRVHVSFICSHFHSTRIRIWYQPYQQGVVVGGWTNPLEQETQDMINVTLDITKETNYSFTIPYCQQSEFLLVDDSSAVSASLPLNNFYNGIWGMSLINPLTSGAATVNPIYFQIFYSAASDFQVSYPTINNIIDEGIIQPQSEDFSVQSEFTLEECEIPSSSMKCLMETEYPCLGGICSGRITTGVYMANEITSIKQLTNMLCPYSGFFLPATPYQYNLYPAGYTSYGLSGIGVERIFNYTLLMQQVFRYQRGGWRYSFRSSDLTTIYQAYSQINFHGPFSPSYTLSAGADINALAYPVGASYNSANAQFGPVGANPADIVLPYYNFYKCYPMNSDPALIGNIDNFPANSMTVNVIAPITTVSLMFYSGADDFILGFQLGIPLMSTTLP